MNDFDTKIRTKWTDSSSMGEKKEISSVDSPTRKKNEIQYQLVSIKHRLSQQTSLLRCRVLGMAQRACSPNKNGINCLLIN